MKQCVQVGNSDSKVVVEKQERLKSQKWMLLIEMADLKIF